MARLRKGSLTCSRSARRRMGCFGVLLCALDAACLGQPLPLRSPSPAASLATQKLVAAEEKSRLSAPGGDAAAYYEALAPLAPPAYSPTAVSNALTGMSLRLKRHEMELVGLKGASGLLDFTFDAAAGLAAATGVKGLALSAVATGIRAQLAYVEKAFDEAGIKNAQAMLGHDLAVYREKYNDPSLGTLDGKTADQVFASVYGSQHPLLAVDLAQVDPRAQGVVTGFLLKAIQDTVLVDHLENLQIERRQDADIAELRQGLTDVGRLMTSYVEQTGQQLADLSTRQEEIRQDLLALETRVDKSEKDIVFLQQFTFGKMLPQQQLAALKSGFFTGMPAVERADLERRVELAAKRAELTESLAGYLNGAATIVKIAGDLQIDSPVVEQISKGVEIGSAAFNVFTSLASQNYLGAVSAITGLMGGGGRDIAGERHSQLVGMLEDVLKGQQQILEGINILRQGQIEIMQNQQKILEAVVTVSQQIAANQEELMAKLQEMQDHVLTIQSLARADLREPIEACRSVLASRRSYGYVGGAPVAGATGQPYGFEVGGRFRSYTALAAHYRNYDGLFEECLRGLLKFDLLDQGSYNPLFRLRTYDDKPGLYPFRVQRYEPLVKLWLAVRRDTFPTPEEMALLIYPAPTLWDLEARLALEDPGKASLRVAPEIALGELLNVEAVEEHTLLLEELHPYFELLDRVPTGQPAPLDTVLADANPRTIGRELLAHNLSVVNAAIAQQSLMAGDILLPDLYDAFKAGMAPGISADSPERKLADEVVARLEKAPLLRSNFLRYALGRELREANVSIFQYATALELPSLVRLRALLSLHWELVETDATQPHPRKIRKIRWGNVEETLPTADNLLQGNLDFTPELQRLLRLRTSLIDQIASYDLQKTFGAERGALLLWLARQSV